MNDISPNGDNWPPIVEKQPDIAVRRNPAFEMWRKADLAYSEALKRIMPLPGRAKDWPARIIEVRFRQEDWSMVLKHMENEIAPMTYPTPPTTFRGSPVKISTASKIVYTDSNGEEHSVRI